MSAAFKKDETTVIWRMTAKINWPVASKTFARGVSMCVSASVMSNYCSFWVGSVVSIATVLPSLAGKDFGSLCGRSRCGGRTQSNATVKAPRSHATFIELAHRSRCFALHKVFSFLCSLVWVFNTIVFVTLHIIWDRISCQSL